jgi:hypothetical protein
VSEIESTQAALLQQGDKYDRWVKEGNMVEFPACCTTPVHYGTGPLRGFERDKFFEINGL